MPDYNLHALSPRDFQHLAQAIARKKISSAINSLGDGKDGARDFTCSGEMIYPVSDKGWKGYLVAGCKFCQKPSGNNSIDSKWAYRQLERDLKKFASKSRKLKKPEYYLFITNVSLTAAADSGGRDKVMDLLKKYKTILNLKDSSVWDYNDIRGFLDGDQNIRRCYGHLITAGDVLHQMVEFIKPSGPNFEEIMHVFLQKELIADVSAKLQSAGDDPDTQIPLTNVFIDLPFSLTAEQANQEDAENPPKVVESLLKAGGRVCRQAEETLLSGSETRRLANYVIIGGPGQGKSTFGQYLCQIYRAEILKDRPIERIDHRVRAIVNQIIATTPTDVHAHVRRFPIRIELRNFSHALASTPKTTLIDYIRDDISKLGGHSLTTEDLKGWLANFPWVLIVDGLDEVPPSSNRTEVLKEISNFRIDAASANADMLVIATTRPQSYSKEFGADEFTHLYLKPLSREFSLKYGAKLAEARCGADERRKDELIRSLQKACQNTATARLMQSPLQVTIMATLLEETGEPPQQKYRLFSEYYRTIYKRETRRKLLGGILSERQRDIDIIHAHTGLLLQAAGERKEAPNTTGKIDDVDSALADSQFKELVKTRLTQVGVPVEKIKELLAKICDETLQRLVFLVRPRDGWVRFDITSLKEFMAAEAIMAGSDDHVRARLKTIAPAPYWRNVFQFCAGKCFVEREHLLDNLVCLCLDFNEAKAFNDPITGKAAKEVLWGSQLALDILADGTARQYPAFERKFVKIALQLIRSSHRDECTKLAYVYHEELIDLYQEAIDEKILSKCHGHSTGGRTLLATLADRNISWAKEKLKLNWPSDTFDQWDLIGGYETWQAPWTHEYLDGLITRLSPHFGQYLAVHSPPSRSATSNSKLIATLSKVFRSREGASVAVRPDIAHILPQAFFVRCAARQDGKDLLSYSLKEPEWLLVTSSIRFSLNPSAETLACELEKIAEHWSSAIRFHMKWFCPWPIGECLARATSSDELKTWAAAARQGDLGNIYEWTLAEKRWLESGVGRDDLMHSSALPWNNNIQLLGFPLFSMPYYSVAGPLNLAVVGQIVASLEAFPKPVRSALARGIFYNWEVSATSPDLTSAVNPLRDLCALAQSRSPVSQIHWMETLLSAFGKGTISTALIDLMAEIGLHHQWLALRDPHENVAIQLAHAFSSTASKNKGLLTVLFELAANGARFNILANALDESLNWGGRFAVYGAALILNSDIELDEARLESCYGIFRDSSDNQMERVARLLNHRHPARSASLLIKTRPKEPKNRDEIIRAITVSNLINRYLTQQPSALLIDNTWNALALPQRV